MSMRLWLLVCGLVLTGCAPDGRAVRGSEGSAEAVGGSIPPRASVLVLRTVEAEEDEAPHVFLPAELLEEEEWSEESLVAAGWSVSFVEAERESGVEPVMARRPPRRGGRGGLTGRIQPPLLNPRPTREEIAARRRQVEEYRLVQQARERYDQALAEARARYPNHQGYQDHHFIPMYLGGPKSGVKYRLQSAYHEAITQEFRRQWAYGQGKPRPEMLQDILLGVYSRYPIPQLIGLNP